MSKVYAEISISLDGYTTGPNVRIGNGMGDDGDRLHDWMFDAKTALDDQVLAEARAGTGAVIIGKGMFDVGFELWGDPPPFGVPVYVITHAARTPLPMQGGTTYIFLNLHLVPILLGGGIRLFEEPDAKRIELKKVGAIKTPGASHFRFEVVKRRA